MLCFEIEFPLGLKHVFMLLPRNGDWGGGKNGGGVRADNGSTPRTRDIAHNTTTPGLRVRIFSSQRDLFQCYWSPSLVHATDGAETRGVPGSIVQCPISRREYLHMTTILHQERVTQTGTVPLSQRENVCRTDLQRAVGAAPLSFRRHGDSTIVSGCASTASAFWTCTSH